MTNVPAITHVAVTVSDLGRSEERLDQLGIAPPEAMHR